MPAMDALFSDDDRQCISDAIAEAEAATTTEIVQHVVVQSGAYLAARWRGGVLGALGMLSVAALQQKMDPGVVALESLWAFAGFALWRWLARPASQTSAPDRPPDPEFQGEKPPPPGYSRSAERVRNVNPEIL